MYVLGTAEIQVQFQIGRHSDDSCAACHGGVRESLRFWTYFAGAWEDTGKPANLRDRLVHLATATKTTVPNLRRRSFEIASVGLFEALAAGIAILVALGAWYAGTRYSHLQNQQLLSELSDAQQHAARLEASLSSERSKREQMVSAEKTEASGRAVSELVNLRRDNSLLRAEVSSYQAFVERDKKDLAANISLLNVFSSPGLRLINLKALEPAANAVAYALILENSKVMLLASTLPKPSSGREYQLWLLRKDDPKVVGAGTFTVEDKDRAFHQFTGTATVSEIAGVAVTEEPVGGSDEPTGPKILVSTSEEQ